jgi:hypothetical protein
MDGADMIERASWGTTMRLVEENLEEDDEIIESSAQKTSEAEVSGELLDNYSLSDRDISFLNACYRGEIPEMHSIANMEFESCDAPAERINEAFADNFGDVILDLCDGEYSVIEDYREDVGIWLSKRMK